MSNVIITCKILHVQCDRGGAAFCLTSSALARGAGRGTPCRDNMHIPAASTPPAKGQSQTKLTVRTRMQKTPYWRKKVRRATAPCRHVWTLLCGEPKGKAQKDASPGDEDIEDLYETWGMAMLVSRLLCFFCAQSRAVTTACVCLLQIVVGFPTILMGTTVLLMIGRIYGG